MRSGLRLFASNPRERQLTTLACWNFAAIQHDSDVVTRDAKRKRLSVISKPARQNVYQFTRPRVTLGKPARQNVYQSEQCRREPRHLPARRYGRDQTLEQRG